MTNIFISHTWMDTKIAQSIEQRLVDVSDKKPIFWRTANIPIGQNWQEEISRRLRSADVFILIITPHYLESTKAMTELGRILEVRSRNQIPTIPLAIGKVRLAETPVSHLFGIHSDSSSEAIIDAADKIAKGIMAQLLQEWPRGLVELYLSYKVLDVSTLATILQCFSNIYSVINNASSESLAESRFESKQSIYDQLLIHTIETGDSIRIRFSSGWKPSFDIINNEIDVCLPRPVKSIAIVGWIISQAVNYNIATVNDLLDLKHKFNQIEVDDLDKTKNELEIEKLRLEIKELKKSDKEKIDENLYQFLSCSSGKTKILVKSREVNVN
jgi:TIR domain